MESPTYKPTPSITLEATPNMVSYTTQFTLQQLEDFECERVQLTDESATGGERTEQIKCLTKLIYSHTDNPQIVPLIKKGYICVLLNLKELSNPDFLIQTKRIRLRCPRCKVSAEYTLTAKVCKSQFNYKLQTCLPTPAGVFYDLKTE